MAERALIWQSSQYTHQGNVRNYNEDACLIRKDMDLWAVADGMGGHEAGDVASNMIMEKLKLVIPHDNLAVLVDRIDDALIDVNSMLRELGQEKYNNRTIGSTVVSLCAVDNHLAYLWAGDSRIYRIRNHEIKQLTKDHSEVQNLIDQGLLRPEEAEFHPSANVITRAIGAVEEPYLSTGVETALPNDIYVMCSDGLYRDITEPEILQLAASQNPEKICQDLMALALSREAKDNITIIVARCIES
ncbi:MAG: protein phosphatase 2C domain-containing protein [Gammaproteobacteria bacterium]|nr:protein phosphatase 2C domain-containing protein [Gammaproteobacteria bacterium]